MLWQKPLPRNSICQRHATEKKRKAESKDFLMRKKERERARYSRERDAAAGERKEWSREIKQQKEEKASLKAKTSVLPIGKCKENVFFLTTFVCSKIPLPSFFGFIYRFQFSFYGYRAQSINETFLFTLFPANDHITLGEEKKYRNDIAANACNKLMAISHKKDSRAIRFHSPPKPLR